jgi:hypothetical protein
VTSSGSCDDGVLGGGLLPRRLAKLGRRLHRTTGEYPWELHTVTDSQQTARTIIE